VYEMSYKQQSLHRISGEIMVRLIVAVKLKGALIFISTNKFYSLSL